MTSLPRTLGSRDLILLTIGSVMGPGTFLVPRLGAAPSGWFHSRIRRNTTISQLFLPVRSRH